MDLYNIVRNVSKIMNVFIYKLLEKCVH